MRIQTVVGTAAELTLLHLEEPPGLRDVAMIGGTGDRPARHPFRHRDAHPAELPVLLGPADRDRVSGAGVDVDVLQRQVAGCRT